MRSARSSPARSEHGRVRARTPAAEIGAPRHPRLTPLVPATDRRPPPRRPLAMRRRGTASTRTAHHRRERYSRDLGDSIRPYTTATPPQPDRIGDDGPRTPYVRTRTSANCDAPESHVAYSHPEAADERPQADRQRRRLRTRGRCERGDRRGPCRRDPHKHEPDGRDARGRARRRAGAGTTRGCRSACTTSRTAPRSTSPATSSARSPLSSSASAS